MSAYEEMPRIVPLRPYQAKMFDDIHAEWAVGHTNILAVLPTGMGKARLLTAVVAQNRGGTCVFAHRQELVFQLCATMNEFKIPFRIIAPPKTRKIIIAAILRKHGCCYHDTQAKVGVAGVDTLIKVRTGKDRATYEKWINSVTLWVGDEGHHIVGGSVREGETYDEAWERSNKWGKGILVFPRSDLKGLIPTATPKRGDGAGMSRESDGCADVMVQGPTMREGLDMGYLNPYRIYTVPCHVHYEDVKVGASGEFVQASLAAAEDLDGALLGDIIDNYRKYAWKKRGITFVSSVARAKEVAERFNSIGIPAAAVDGEMDPDLRAAAIRKLESGENLMLVNAAIFEEGVDLPALEVLIMATATNSLGRFMQWTGRLLRLMLRPEQWAGYDDLTDAGRLARIADSPKPFGILIDMGSNVIRHGGPAEAPRAWSMGRNSKKSSPGETIPYRVCANPGVYLANPAGHTWESFRKAGWTNEQMLAAGHLVESGLACCQPYERIFRACPYCSFFPEPQGRKDPEQVEGDLQLLDAETLEALYANVRQATQTVEQYEQYMASTRVNALAYGANVKRHKERLEALARLRHVMGYWGGLHKQRGDSDPVLQRRFYHLFGLDVISAQALKRAEAEELTARITAKLLLDGIGIAEYSQVSTTEDSPQ